MTSPSGRLLLESRADAGRFPVLLLTVILALALPACSGGGSNGGNGPAPPATPSGLSATSQDRAIALGWNAADGADTYRVYRGTSSGVDASGSPLSTGIGSAEYTDESAENGTKYYYVVTAVAEEGGESAESSPSDEVEKTPFSEPPSRP